MTQSSDDQLVALISREQRGIRRTMYAGLLAIFFMVAMSGAMAVFYWKYSEQIREHIVVLEEKSDELFVEAFNTRRDVDSSVNRISDLDALNLIMSEEMRLLAGRSVEDKVQPEKALLAAEAYFQRGTRDFVAERNIEEAALQQTDTPLGALLAGARALQAWERSRDTISSTAIKLPPDLTAAQATLSSVSEDADLGALANLGLAWVAYLDAASQRTNYSAESCDRVVSLLARAEASLELGPQPRYWRGQCYRKRGQTALAMQDFSKSLLQSINSSSSLQTGPAAERAEIALEMNAFHGLGTVLIAAPDLSSVEGIREAEAACRPDEFDFHPASTRLAFACLSQAVRLRSQLRQTANQLSGTAENLGFVYLRQQAPEEALKHAISVHGTGLFAWNELLRALSAQLLANAEQEKDARRYVRQFKVEQFNLCELKVLLSPDHFSAAVAIIQDARPALESSCLPDS